MSERYFPIIGYFFCDCIRRETPWESHTTYWECQNCGKQRLDAEFDEW